MIVNDLTRRAMKYRKGNASLSAEGFIRISEHGDPLWKFQRGGWASRIITDVRIGPDGKELWIKVSEPIS